MQLKKMTFALGLLLLSLIAVSAFCQPVSQFRAVKLTNVDSDVLFSDQNIAEAMDYLASIGINTVLVVVWNSNRADGDYTLYPSSVMQDYFGQSIHPLFQNRDPLKRVIIEAHRNGIEVLPWFEMGFSTSRLLDGGHILATYPEWALRDSDGKLTVKNYFEWMSAINPQVREFMLALTLEVADNYDIDGIEYSDRIPAMPISGGYDSVTVAVYRSEHNNQNPPTDTLNAQWMRWRADKLTGFFAEVRDSIKARSEHLIISSSPSLYPWSYENYLQDSKTWVETGIADNIIPQVYRYSFSEYMKELDLSLSHFPDHRDVYYAGMLIKYGEYLIDPGFFLNCIQANRERQVHGEVFFFYEGLRDNNNQLGDTLRTTYYQQAAVVPERDGLVWRPRGLITNETDEKSIVTGEWEYSDISGFTNGVLLYSGSQQASVVYHFDLPYSAWFDVFVYNVTGPLASQNTTVVLYSGSDSAQTTLDQSNARHRGWQQIGTKYITQGVKKVVKISNTGLPEDKIVVADAAMLMINRKRSPQVIITDRKNIKNKSKVLPEISCLEQNYPNPFNPITTICYQLSAVSKVELSIFSVLGQKLGTLVSGRKQAGCHHIKWDASKFASGIYLYQLKTERGYSEVKKMIVIK